MPNKDHADILRRAVATYLRTVGTLHQSAMQQRIEAVGEFQYAVLRTAGQLLAVYRIGNDGSIWRLRRWPAQIT